MMVSGAGRGPVVPTSVSGLLQLVLDHYVIISFVSKAIEFKLNFERISAVIPKRLSLLINNLVLSNFSANSPSCTCFYNSRRS